ncbi:MAG: ABC transporter ATP-binding protein, partial [Solirubrobacterales bacterium]|nr:ABC transporter ATP-binding protein [Solirubrobacterales bacterium]
LVGHNGCGKSTLLRCIAGIYRPTEGHVKVAGRISTLLELGAGFHPDLTGRENVYMNATILGMTKKQIDASFDEIVAFAGIEEFIDSPVKIYSTGMFVRLGFSVAVHVDPEILIVDEVIAVGDEEFQRRCFDHLYGLRKQGVTIVVVTHGMNTVETMCDKAAWLDHGILQMVGESGEVARAYMEQVNVREREARAAAADIVGSGQMPESLSVPSTREPGLGEEMEILDVYFTDKSGERITAIETDAEISINVHYRAHTEIDNPVIGFRLHSEGDVQLMGVNTKLGNFITGTILGDGLLRFTFPELQLLPGNYEFSIDVNDRHIQHLFDRRTRQYHLTVRRGSRPIGIGFVEMPGRWSFLR